MGTLLYTTRQFDLGQLLPSQPPLTLLQIGWITIPVLEGEWGVIQD